MSGLEEWTTALKGIEPAQKFLELNMLLILSGLSLYMYGQI
jgi:hypothetical protein